MIKLQIQDRNRWHILAWLLYLTATSLIAQTPTDWVNPFIGTTNFGATHPGAQYPHALASVTPFNVAFKEGAENPIEKDAGWNSRSYIYENGYLTGFSHANLSGVGCPDLGVLLLMPTTGERTFDASAYGSTYSEETATPGYYSCQLDKYDIKAEVSSTLRSGISRYTFPKGKAHILLNLGLGLTNETGGMVKINSPQEVEGYRMIGTFCYNPEDVRPVYFVARLSKAAQSFGTWKKMPAYKGPEGEWTRYNDTWKPYEGFMQEMAGDDIGAYFTFDTDENEVIEVQLGISYVSIENARANLEAEQPGFDFEQIRQQSKNRWDELLNRAQVKGTDEQKTLFYTALYHSLIHPNILQDVNGEYPLMGQPGIGKMEQGRNRYTVFSLWDTYRNVHPLLSLLYPEIQEEMVQTMVDMYDENGWLPKWELLSMETNVMVGDPGTPVIADTYLRGIQGFDIEKAYAAAWKAAITPESDNLLRPDIDAYSKLGYVPMDGEDQYGGSVSTALEYYLSDWTLAQLALALGKSEDAKLLSERAKGYLNYLDPETGMLRPKYANGKFYENFDPEEGKNFEPVTGFVEGTAWQYRFYVPHDIPFLIDTLGGSEAFVNALSTCFSDDQYDVANEPDITYPFLYNYVPGSEWRTQEQVLKIIREHYTNTPGGIPGNDDTGTLSTWLAFSMMGLYPVCPADMDYAIFTPSFEEVRLQLHPDYYPGKALVIKASKKDEPSIYIQSARFNNKKVKRLFLSHQSLTEGGTLELDLTSKPKKK